MRERMAFGPDLRRARERRGLSLEQIAERTKVAASLYAGLERNDLSRWPSGLFRRAFVRAYADAVGLDPEETCRRFVELFPEDGTTSAGPAPASVETVPAAAPAPANAGGGPRLVLAVPPGPARPAHRGWRRVGAAATDVALAMLPAAIVSLLAGVGWFWLVAGAVGATGHVLVLIATGTTPGGWLFLDSRPAAAARQEADARRTRPEAPPKRDEPQRESGARSRGQRQQGPRAVVGRRYPR